jgi:hypothetical protein
MPSSRKADLFMHDVAHNATPSQQSDAAKLGWLRLDKPARRVRTDPAREARRQRIRDQLPAGLDPDEIERRVDEFIAIEMRTLARRRHAAEKKAKELAAEAAALEAALER